VFEFMRFMPSAMSFGMASGSTDPVGQKTEHVDEIACRVVLVKSVMMLSFVLHKAPTTSTPSAVKLLELRTLWATLRISQWSRADAPVNGPAAAKRWTSKPAADPAAYMDFPSVLICSCRVSAE
jgi:hypothetical protein